MKTNQTTDKATARPNGTFADYNYLAITPQADTEKLASATARIMIYHLRGDERGVKVFFAEKGVLNAGWVIGIVDPSAIKFTQQSEHSALLELERVMEKALPALAIAAEDKDRRFSARESDRKLAVELRQALSTLANLRKEGA